MTRAELVIALRERFATLRADFPELVEIMRYASSERVLYSHCKCGCCGKFHFTPAELVERAAGFDDVESLFAQLEKIARKRFPARCLRLTDRIEAAITSGRN